LTTMQTESRAVVWRPDAETVRNANLTDFMARHGIADYEALVVRSDAEPDWFWPAVMEHFDIRFETPFDRILDTSDGIAEARWCIGGKGNLALSCVDKQLAEGRGAQMAVVWESEQGEVRSWTYDRLNEETCRLAAGLSGIGIKRGDVVGLYMPMLPEICAAYLAIARIGAIVLPLFSGFGAAAVATRLNDGGAIAVISADATVRRGRPVAMKAVIDEAAPMVPTLEHVVVLRDKGGDLPMTPDRDHDWHAITAEAPTSFDPVIVDADDPLMIVFTSGTTGKAKGTVHTHYGFATKVVLDLGLCLDFKPGDRMLWMSDMGWLVGPILVVGATAMGGTLVLAEGAPNYPEPGRIWRLAQDHAVSFLGIAPTIVRTLMRDGEGEVAKYDLSSLRIAASTGEPWDPDSWMWFFEHVCRSKVPLLNFSGGTEIGGGIITGTVLHPLKPCSFAGAVPGMGADILDDDGRPVGPDQVGELVMRCPSIGLTRGLWKDPERYIDSYWSRWPDIWVHGDWASRDSDGMWYVHGRSDDTVKMAGKRTGPAEIEALLLATGLILEAAAVGVSDPVKGEAVVCVCVPRPDKTPDAALAEALRTAVAEGLGSAFRPRQVVFVNDLPKTRNMKIMRRVVRAAFSGKPAGDLSNLVNPEAVDELKRVLANES
jgi:acetyl-CoA synthetase